MKGVILAGGFGTRLKSVTHALNDNTHPLRNKHLVRVLNNFMVSYPLKSLVNAGIKDIIIVVGGESVGEVLECLQDGKNLGANIYYAYQSDKVLGIPTALFMARKFIGTDQHFAVILGDNFISDSLKPYLEKFINSEAGANILLKEVDHPEQFGLAEVKKDRVIKCVEKPKKPKTNLAVTGIYFFDWKVWNIIPKLQLSQRKETEIVDVLNWYIKNDKLTYDIIKGNWYDLGSWEAIYKAEELLKKGD